MKIPRTARNIVISVIVILLVLVGGGTLYTLLAGDGAPANTAVVPARNAETDAAPKPIMPAANAPEGVSIGSLTTPITPGTNASLQIRTNAISTCTISVTYNNVPSTDSGLGPKKADDYGVATWTWTVGPTVPVGKWPIKVTCAYNGRSGVIITYLEVTKG